MRTLSVQQMPDGYELETPSPFYWFKAGAAFTLGAGIVYIASQVLWVLLIRAVPDLYLLRLFRIV